MRQIKLQWLFYNSINTPNFVITANLAVSLFTISKKFEKVK
jgi:hypothetical protein